ncbi:hypothetical protein QLS31_07085 [Flavobacterium sp. XS2P24]|jgi:hypothetical protein|uniref:hypothetical protein n=1 Tax=Flavobacterium sp. XS2P24 TaxID=3041249 RepID=UPI0024A9BC8D|nr:hypothetical protein [Flavobacterium sp. XS2P24]MDI6049590.1 hypothetical protein [Flavobacterium sp. XS2P24]
MTAFKDLNIQAETNNFTGDKVRIKTILNVEIKVLDFNIKKSKVKENTEVLTIHFERNGIKNIVFTGSTILMKMIQQVPKDKFPFTTTIIQDNEYFEFT